MSYLVKGPDALVICAIEGPADIKPFSISS